MFADRRNTTVTHCSVSTVLGTLLSIPNQRTVQYPMGIAMWNHDELRTDANYQLPSMKADQRSTMDQVLAFPWPAGVIRASLPLARTIDLPTKVLRDNAEASAAWGHSSRTATRPCELPDLLLLSGRLTTMTPVDLDRLDYTIIPTSNRTKCHPASRAPL
jgi:hypothetical protein